MRRPSGLILALTLLILASPARSEPTHITLAPGEPLDTAAAQTLLAPALAAATGAEAVRVAVAEPALPLNNPYAAVAHLAVVAARATTVDGFEATIRISVGQHAPMPLRLSGTMVRLVPVPVPATTIAAGRLLVAADLETRWLPAQRIRGTWARSTDAIVGQEALRPLLSGQPILADAVGAERLVHRGDLVRLIYARGRLRLEASGTARGDGGLGAMVAVRNDRSGAVVSGRVTGHGQVEVEDPR